jgi:alkylated DNA repair dioxygenase AlkB
VNSLFPHEPPGPLPARLPPGFRYEREFISREEEAALLAVFAGLEFANSRYHEYTALRRTVSFSLWPEQEAGGRAFDRPPYAGNSAAPRPLAPELLAQLARKVAQFAGRSPLDFQHLLVTEYPPGAPMGWHRDAPPCAVIYGVSLGSDCRFGLRPYALPSHAGACNSGGGGGTAVMPDSASRVAFGPAIRLSAERRSLYVMAGPARSDWQHCIAPVKALRYSVTLRTLS